MTKIDIKLTFNCLAWTLHFVEPIVEIDGLPYKVTWGKHFFDLSPGNHSLKIYFSYNGKPKSGLKTIQINISEGKTNKIQYKIYPFLYPSIKII
jgi:hypothetical protein